MTDPHVDTLQYRHFLNQINKALPLELTIRAAGLAYPKELEELRNIDKEIRDAWKERGFTEEEVEQNGLVELCWDITQLGWSERRNPFEQWEGDVLKEIQGGIRPICDRYLSTLDSKDYPFAKRYRFADIVRGMDISRVLREYLSKYSNLRIAPDGDGISISNFILSVRTPVPVVPGALQHIRLQGPKQSAYFGLVLKYDMSLEDVRAALLDFQFHYAKFRLAEHSLGDETTHRLLDPWGMPSMPTKEEIINQAHQLHPKLAGLYSYDRFEANGGAKSRGARARALEETMELHPEAVMPEASRAGKWLDSIRKEIGRLAKQFKAA